MTVRLGFIVVSHSAQSPAVALCRDLATLYEDPPIALHHDEAQAAIDLRQLPDCVARVTPSTRTGWGTMGVVRATVRALTMLFSRADAPDWFALLTESCYPVASPHAVRAELAATDADVLLDHHPILYRDVAAPTWDAMPPLGFGPGRGTQGYDVAQKRFYRWARTIRLPFLPPITMSTAIRRGWVGRWTLPITPERPCYCGSAYFTGTARAADVLIRALEDGAPLARHFAALECVDEAAFHTALCHAPGLRVQQGSRRYIDWRAGGAHPRELTIDDWSPLVGSGAHFARKVGLSPADPLRRALQRAHGLDESGGMNVADTGTGGPDAVGLVVAGTDVTTTDAAGTDAAAPSRDARA